MTLPRCIGVFLAELSGLGGRRPYSGRGTFVAAALGTRCTTTCTSTGWVKELRPHLAAFADA